MFALAFISISLRWGLLQKGTVFTAAPILFVNGAHVRSIALPSNITVRSVVGKWTKDSQKTAEK